MSATSGATVHLVMRHLRRPVTLSRMAAAIVLSFCPSIARAAEPEPVPQAERPWVDRWSPERHQVEVGVFLGALVPSRELELYAPQNERPDRGFVPLRRAAPVLGGRAGYFPIRHLGVEAEGGAMPTRIQTGARATLWSLRAQLVGQVGLWRITPFVLAGAGALAVQSRPAAVGRDVDLAVHVGGGAKLFVNRWLALRLDARDVIGAGRNVGRIVHSGEVLVGVTFVLGRGKDSPRSSPRPAGPARVPVDAEPAPDRDGDGIADAVDDCVDVPETVNAFADDDGCPDELPAAVQRFEGVIDGIFFAMGSAAIESTSRPTLDDAVDALLRYPEVRVRIVGHTDDIGSRDHNVELSRTRAQAVAEYLVARGIAPERLEVDGAGPDRPLVPNTDATARARNRRIEFHLIHP